MNNQSEKKGLSIFAGILGGIILIGLVFLIVCVVGSSLKDLSFVEYVKQLFVK